MSIIYLVAVLALIGVLLYVLANYFPIDPVIMRVIYGVVIIFLCLWLFREFFGGFPALR